ncbi:Translocon-associated protein subunit gamma [Caenorhabditis elegans]|uniref:Translocon-associated protein subunit gamma n=1 Tax=Caenorhabditis elegans TaxID=6239 RepID=Q95XS1_CAEEL|nr:Translocon-associated protein subunit gamma [Caenorhabditis elegans]CCD67380.1 Translocon-associated protein subunit gamma [Caenorhabditis elegans]|eukprot:NP_500198.1 TRanslocon-Associated Protein [Caenorhabditis elegans]
MGKLTKEEELLLSSYSATSSTKGNLFFYLNALIISIAPLYLFYGVHQMEIQDSLVVWGLSAVGTAYLLSLACKNQKCLLKHQIVMKRGSAVEREISGQYAADKKMTVKEKEERALFRKNEVADTESTYLSVFYTNSLYLTIMLVSAFFLLANVAPVFNLLISTIGSAGLVAFLSTAKN